MSKRSVLGFIYTLQSLQAQGIDLSILERRYGIQVDKISPEGEIDRALELRVYCDILPTNGPETLGLNIGRTISLAGYGPFIMLLLTCDNAWDAFHTGIHYQRLTYIFGTLGISIGKTESVLWIQPAPLPEQCRRYLIDRDMSGTYQLIRDLQSAIGTDFKPVRVRLPYPPPHNNQCYEDRFQCPVEFNAERAEAVIPTQHLAIPFPGANKTAHRLYQQQCDEILRALDQPNDSLQAQVIDYLELFTDHFPSLQAVATTFGMSERSFRRKLSTEDTSFRRLMDQVRFAKAKHLLCYTSISIDTMAERLGYSEASAFIHAFQRWSNQSPAKYRTLNSK